MLVHVVCLRHNGNKLPPDVIAATTPVRGELTIENPRRFDGNGIRYNLIVATLEVKVGALPVPQLLNAVVGRMKGDAFVVAGLEVQPKPSGLGAWVSVRSDLVVPPGRPVTRSAVQPREIG